MSDNIIRTTGVDCGTLFFQTAEQNGENIKLQCIRNAFVQINATDDIEDVLKQNNWQYVKDDVNYYVIGEDSLKVAKLFPGSVELRRPMQDGVLNKNEPEKMLIMSELMKRTIGEAKNNKSVACVCVSSPSVDDSVDSSFHKARLSGMLKRLGWNVKVIEEGLAVILSERPTIIDSEGKEAPYSGVSLCIGAGKANCVLAYKGLQIVGMSSAFAGDKIDKKVSDQLGVPISKVMSKKEKELDFSNLDEDDDILYALNVYYEVMLEYIFKHFSKKFAEVKSEFDAPLDLIIAGGSTMPKDFHVKCKNIINGLKLPFTIKEVRMATDPRNSVVKGCLTQAIITQKKISKASDDELSAILGE
jgi:hypothetical protein